MNRRERENRMEDSLQKNVQRFTGFAETYDQARPSCPAYVLRVLRMYLGRRPETVVDLGCGTGLSTFVWKDDADSVVGVDPSADMIAVAREKAARCRNVKFRQRFAHDTGLPDSGTDIITCSQSFHWMDPIPTLREVGRILRPGGIFAAYDCDWPSVCNWRAELAYRTLFKAVERIKEGCPELQNTCVRWDKSRHLENLDKSGYFAYTREIVFQNTEPCTAKRFILLAVSQGDVQTILKKDAKALLPHLREYSKAVRSIFGSGGFSVDFCYRIRIGIKKES